ncbi:ferredoxin [Streptomyces sp. NPDC091272]|uniref:ferredoxin n=1 Tax=Streptomyces sp. NPDC091272 TaxID=3365981 RepID=UPI00380CD024
MAETEHARGGAEVTVTADRERCLGAGMCVLTAPAVFDQDTEDGLVLVLRPRLPLADTEMAAVQEAAALCPAKAISW